MVDRIAELVNETLTEENFPDQLSREQVLELIGSGASQGGAEVNRSSCCASPEC